MEYTSILHPYDSHMAISQNKQMFTSRAVALYLGYMQLIDLKN